MRGCSDIDGMLDCGFGGKADIRQRLPTITIYEAPTRRSGGEGKPANALRHVGTAISHASPSARQSRRISPFSCPRIMLSITRVPKP
jgi:hypothetical protein